MVAERLLDKLTPERRRSVGGAIVDLTIVGWPLSHFIFASTGASVADHFINALSWFAVTLTGWDVLSTSDVRVEQEEG